VGGGKKIQINQQGVRSLKFFKALKLWWLVARVAWGGNYRSQQKENGMQLTRLKATVGG
jgi:hypothetical protein